MKQIEMMQPVIHDINHVEGAEYMTCYFREKDSRGCKVSCKYCDGKLHRSTANPRRYHTVTMNKVMNV